MASGLYEFWKRLTPEAVYDGALVGFYELLRTGCTTTSDHHYVFPADAPGDLIDAQIRAAQQIGIRFHATRGSMSLGRDMGGLPPMSVVQKEEAILEDSDRLISRYHDAGDFAMTRIALAPCSPLLRHKEPHVGDEGYWPADGVSCCTRIWLRRWMRKSSAWRNRKAPLGADG